jgi:L-threonylcarbamoyladenylate synthase
MILNASDAAVAQAAQALRDGHLVGLPTETVYGLAANATDDAAVAQIFVAKGRPADHPLIVHVASAAQVPVFASQVPGFAQALIDAFWPGPLTLILPRQSGVATASAGGQDSIGLRCPSHPVAQRLLQTCAAMGVQGVSAPSANRLGRVSPTTAAHVQSELGTDLLILDGGECAVGIESTIVDCTRAAPVLLRPGVLTPQQLSEACGVSVITPDVPDAEAPRASGTLASHYAPSAQVQLMSAANLQMALDAYGQATSNHVAVAGRVAVWSRSVLRVPEAYAAQIQWQPMPQDPAECAHQLFAQLRAFDAQGVAQIWVELPPLSPAWDGVLDRLTRAATPTR